MNTIHDLRGTLAEHAEIHDVEIGTRPSAIARRVRVVRRRRLAGVGAAVAVVLAAAAGLTLPHIGGNTSPAARVLGVAVPTTLTSTGYTYGYDSSVTSGDGTAATVTVDPGSTPVLVSWATEDADQRVSVSTPFTDFTSTMDDFTDFVVVPEGAGPTKVKVSGAGPTALAVYHLDATPPAGVTTDGITFRQDVPGRELVGARIGAEGANRITFDVTVPQDGSGLEFAKLCTATKGTMNAQHEAWLAITVDGKPAWETGCSAGSTFDPGGLISSGPETGYRPGQHLTLGLTLLDRPHGQLLQDSHARIGYAAYAVTTPEQTFPGGLSLPTVAESDGHTWRLVKSGSGVTRGSAPWSLTTPASAQRLMIWYAVDGGPGSSSAQAMIDGKDTESSLEIGPRVGAVWNVSGGVVDAGHHVFSMTVRGAGQARTAVGYYELVD